MAIPFDSYCIECNIKRHLALARSLGPEEQAYAFGKRLMEAMLAVPEGEPSPVLGPVATELFREFYDLPEDRFRQEKECANRFVLERLEDIRRRVESAPDSLLAGLKMAILGNYLDFSALYGQVDLGKLEEMLREALEMELDEKMVEKFRKDLEKGGNLLYLTDNAGEIGFDRVFAETISRLYPGICITFCVRGGIASNDATRTDAQAVGIGFPVIDNGPGNTVAGTYLPRLGEEARQAMEHADLILSKGMGNCETLYGCGKNIYYAFLVKCPKFVHLFGKPLMTPLFVHDRGL